MIKIVTQLILLIFPWPLRRILLCKIFGFELSPKSHIGISILLAKKVILHQYAKIGSLTFSKAIDKIEIGEHSSIGSLNFITGFSTSIKNFKHFKHIKERKCEIILGKHTAITSRHFFDCNGGIYIGNYSEVAGYQSLFLTHSIDVYQCRQDAQPIIIGDYVFIGTRCTFLKGSIVPSYTIIGACALVNKKLTENYVLYAGVPAKKVKEIKEKCLFFNREQGFVF